MSRICQQLLSLVPLLRGARRKQYNNLRPLQQTQYNPNSSLSPYIVHVQQDCGMRRDFLHSLNSNPKNTCCNIHIKHCTNKQKIWSLACQHCSPVKVYYILPFGPSCKMCLQVKIAIDDFCTGYFNTVSCNFTYTKDISSHRSRQYNNLHFCCLIKRHAPSERYYCTFQNFIPHAS